MSNEFNEIRKFLEQFLNGDKRQAEQAELALDNLDGIEENMDEISDCSDMQIEDEFALSDYYDEIMEEIQDDVDDLEKEKGKCEDYFDEFQAQIKELKKVNLKGDKVAVLEELTDGLVNLFTIQDDLMTQISRTEDTYKDVLDLGNEVEERLEEEDE